MTKNNVGHFYDSHKQPMSVELYGTPL